MKKTIFALIFGIGLLFAYQTQAAVQSDHSPPCHQIITLACNDIAVQVAEISDPCTGLRYPERLLPSYCIRSVEGSKSKSRANYRGYMNFNRLL